MAGDFTGCSKNTPKKWERLRYFLEYHMKATVGIINRHRFADRSYHYVDLYAGPGVYTMDHDPSLAGERGSPLIALDVAKSLGVPIKAYFVEQKHHESLRRSVFESGYEDRATIFAGKCEKAIENILACVPSNAMGFMFIDPSGYPCWETAEYIARRRKLLDVMVNLNAAIHKRCYGSSKHYEDMRPTQHLHSLGKHETCYWAPAPGDKWQFCLTYLTNGPVMEAVNQGFHDSRKEKGKLVKQVIDFTTKERRGMSNGFLPGMGF